MTTLSSFGESDRSVVVSNRNDQAIKAIVAVVLRTSQGAVLLTLTEDGEVPANGSLNFGGFGSVQMAVAIEADHWTIDVEWEGSARR
jgi:hypothetical protein